jgi:hypothetical protein
MAGIQMPLPPNDTIDGNLWIFPKGTTREQVSITYRWLFDYARGGRVVRMISNTATLPFAIISWDEVEHISLDEAESIKSLINTIRKEREKHSKELKKAFPHIKQPGVWMKYLYGMVENGVPCP